MLKEIHFLNARVLAEALKKNCFSEELAFKHLLVYSVLFAGQVAAPLAFSGSGPDGVPAWIQVFSYVLMAVVQFWGMRMLYQINKAGDGVHFFARWAALSLPVGTQVAIAAALLGAALGVASGLLAANHSEVSPEWVWSFIGIVFCVGIQFLYFKLMRESFEIASGCAAADKAVE